MFRRFLRAALQPDVGTIGSVVALAVVLIIPALRTHHFARSYKPIEAQATVRHWSLDLNEERAARSIDQAAESPSLTVFVPPVVPAPALEDRDRISPPQDISRLMVRLRLGPSRASEPPLLS